MVLTVVDPAGSASADQRGQGARAVRSTVDLREPCTVTLDGRRGPRGSPLKTGSFGATSSSLASAARSAAYGRPLPAGRTAGLSFHPVARSTLPVSATARRNVRRAAEGGEWATPRHRRGRLHLPRKAIAHHPVHGRPRTENTSGPWRARRTHHSFWSAPHADLCAAAASLTSRAPATRWTVP